MLTVVGLGNPGRAYKKTKHNAGFMLLDGIVDGRFIKSAKFTQSGLDFITRFFTSRRKFERTAGPFVKIEGELSGKQFVLVKPTTYMNESGKAFSSLITKGVVKNLSEFLVVVDDVDCMLGSFRLRKKGSAGGHNGLKSIISHLGTNEFSRLKVGVGPRPKGSEMTNYVLGTFLPEEFELFEKTLGNASEVVAAWIQDGYESAHNIIKNKQKQTITEEHI